MLKRDSKGDTMRFAKYAAMAALITNSVWGTIAVGDGPTYAPPTEGVQSDTQESPISLRSDDPDRLFNSLQPPVSTVSFLNHAGCNDRCGSCGSCDSCGSTGLLGSLDSLGLTRFASDHEFDDFIEPVTNPLWFEDPRSRTRVRFVMINQMIPEDSILAGGDLQVYALQVSLALSDRLALIAVKDGYSTLQSDALPNEQGWGDIAAGLKYVFIRDVEDQFLLTGGFTYELSQGSADVFQGNGDGMWNFFLATGKQFGPVHFLGAAGWHLPNNGNKESESIFYSVHLDYEMIDSLYALWELNGIHYTGNGNALPGVNVEGGDWLNLGAGNVDGNNFVSTAFGLTKVFNPHFSIAWAHEFPITERKDLMDNRDTFMMILTY